MVIFKVLMVYLVDDDIDDLELVHDAFLQSGYRGPVICAKNGQDFILKLNASNLPELIVLDLNMPLKDGFEVLTELKKSKNLSVVPVAILTASHNQQDEKKCADLGCSLFLRKPSTFSGYEAIVTTLLQLLQNYKGHNADSTDSREE